MPMMDWFERITGFKERGYAETQSLLSMDGGRLRSAMSDRRPAVGRLEIPSLSELRQRVSDLASANKGNLRVACIQGDVRALHAHPAHAGGLFQVASQFNLLEMVGPEVTPEEGVARYEWDRTQGPACAMAAGAGTLYRNYLVEVNGQRGQARDRQIDCLRDVGEVLGNQGHRLWRMQNGYALLTPSGLGEIDQRLAAMSRDERDGLKARLRIGVHWHTEVTDLVPQGHTVSQAFCSALPVAPVYSGLDPGAPWRRFATLVLEGAYEATLLAAALNRHQSGSDLVFLTRLGGGAFGNDDTWIDAAMRHALARARHLPLNGWSAMSRCRRSCRRLRRSSGIPLQPESPLRHGIAHHAAAFLAEPQLVMPLRRRAAGPRERGGECPEALARKHRGRLIPVKRNARVRAHTGASSWRRQ